jgi:hypothetical protein
LSLLPLAAVVLHSKGTSWWDSLQVVFL